MIITKNGNTSSENVWPACVRGVTPSDLRCIVESGSSVSRGSNYESSYTRLSGLSVVMHGTANEAIASSGYPRITFEDISFCVNTGSGLNVGIDNMVRH